jgi:hypothetical protein
MSVIGALYAGKNAGAFYTLQIKRLLHEGVTVRDLANSETVLLDENMGLFRQVGVLRLR